MGNAPLTVSKVTGVSYRKGQPGWLLAKSLVDQLQAPDAGVGQTDTGNLC
jgi:hypothetical protein